MSKTPQMPPQAPKANPNDTTLGIAAKAPENVNPAPPKRIDEAYAIAEIGADPGIRTGAGESVVKTQPTMPGLSEFIDGSPLPSGEMIDPTPKVMIAGTVANPKTMPLIKAEVRAYAVVRAEDGLWRAVRYKIQGANVVEIKTKEPDVKGILAAQVTDALALDMPLFNDEDEPRG